MSELARVTKSAAGVKAADPHVVAALSQRHGVDEGEIHAVYTQEYTRLAAEARIQNYVPVLALHNTHARLRRRAAKASSH